MNELVLAIVVIVEQLAANFITYSWLALASLAVTALYTGAAAYVLHETPRWLMTQSVT